MSFIQADVTVVGKKVVLEINKQPYNFKDDHIEIFGFLFRTKAHPEFNGKIVYLKGTSTRKSAANVHISNAAAKAFAQELVLALIELNIRHAAGHIKTLPREEY